MIKWGLPRINLLPFSQLIPILTRTLELKDRKIATKVGFTTKQRMFRTQF